MTLHAGVILLLGLIPSRPIAESESTVIELWNPRWNGGHIPFALTALSSDFAINGSDED